MSIEIRERLSQAARWCVLGAILLVPLVLTRQTADIFNLTKITVLFILTILGLVCWVASCLGTKKLPPARLVVAGSGFLGAIVVTSATSDNPLISVVGIYQRYGGLLSYALYFSFFILVVGTYWKSPDALSRVVDAITVASALLSIYVLVQAAGLDWVDWRDDRGLPPPYPVGTMGNSNFAGGYLGIALPVVLHFSMVQSKRFRPWIYLLPASVVSALWFTQTRGGFLAAAMGTGMLAFINRARLTKWLQLLLPAAGTMALGLAVMIITGAIPSFLSSVEALRTDTLTIRSYFWSAAFRIFVDRPLIGTGPETFAGQYTLYRLPADGAHLGLSVTQKPHNVILEHAANMGVLGAGSFALLLGLGIWLGYRAGRSKQEPLGGLAAAFTAMLVAYIGQAILSIDVPPLAVLPWAALAGIAVVADPAIASARQRLQQEIEHSEREAPGQSKKQRRKRPRKASRIEVAPMSWAGLVVICALSLVLLFGGLKPWRADLYARDGKIDEENKDLVSATSAYLEAASLHPLEAVYRNALGQVAQKRGEATKSATQKRTLLQEATKRFEEATDLQPGNIFFIINAAKAEASYAENVDLEHFELADRWWRRAIARDPTDWAILDGYSFTLNSWANATGDEKIRLRTVEILRKLVGVRPAHVAGWINLGKTYVVLGYAEEARTAFESALRLEPENPEAARLLASL